MTQTLLNKCSITGGTGSFEPRENAEAMEGVMLMPGTRFNPHDKRRKYWCTACKKNPKPSRSCKGCIALRKQVFDKRHPEKARVNCREYYKRHREKQLARRKAWYRRMLKEHHGYLLLKTSRERYGKEFAEAHRALLQLAKQLKKEN